MMYGVRAPPIIVGREGDDAYDAPDPVIERGAPEEGAMAAIVLDHEEANDEAGGRRCKEQADPPKPVIGREPRESPKNRQRRRAEHDFQDAASVVRFLVAGEDLTPGASVKRLEQRNNLLATHIRRQSKVSRDMLSSAAA
jgi:hypothetical protein